LGLGRDLWFRFGDGLPHLGEVVQGLRRSRRPPVVVRWFGDHVFLIGAGSARLNGIVTTATGAVSSDTADRSRPSGWRS
jgi:hypothetical protein